MERIQQIRISACLAFLLISGCGASSAIPTYPGVLRGPDQFSVDFLLQQNMSIRFGERELSLRTALQRRGDELTLIGLTPLGTRAFVVQQQGLEVEASSSLPETEGPQFPPRYILFDIQRTLLPVIGGEPLSDGEHRSVLNEEEVIEQWRSGRIIERRFRRVSGEPSGEIVIRYDDDGYEIGGEPGRIELQNGWMGYEVVLETLSYQEL